MFHKVLYSIKQFIMNTMAVWHNTYFTPCDNNFSTSTTHVSRRRNIIRKVLSVRGRPNFGFGFGFSAECG